MKSTFIKNLCESEIRNTELALAVESMSDELQSMIEKITNIKVKDLSTLVKKLKYDNNIEKAQDFESSVGSKLDQLVSTITEIKGQLDNDIVSLFNDGTMSDEASEDESDIDAELNSDEEESEEEHEEEDSTLDADLDELDRALK